MLPVLAGRADMPTLPRCTVTEQTSVSCWPTGNYSLACRALHSRISFLRFDNYKHVNRGQRHPQPSGGLLRVAAYLPERKEDWKRWQRVCSGAYRLKNISRTINVINSA